MEVRAMKGFLRLAAALFFATCLIQTAGAVTIGYELTNIEDNRWQYDYTISNDSTEYFWDAISIVFEYGSYSNLTLGVGVYDADEYLWIWNDEWMLVLGEPTYMTGDGELLAFNFFGLSPDQSVSGLTVSFDWLGNGKPGDQLFTIIDVNDPTYTVGGGVTSNLDTSDVPEPQTFMLLGTGILGIAAYYRRVRKAGKR
jgi:hypothetical protein